MAVLARLTAGRQGQLPDTPKPGDPLFVGAHTCVVGDNRVAALAACRRAEVLGYRTLLLTSFVEGEAAAVSYTHLDVYKRHVYGSRATECQVHRSHSAPNT